MTAPPRPGEVFLERFVVACHKYGAGYVKGRKLGHILFTPDLRLAQRFPSKDALREALADNPGLYEPLACTAEIRIGPAPKPPAAAAPPPKPPRKPRKPAPAFAGDLLGEK